MTNEQRKWPAMKPKAFFLVAAVFALILTGCGGGGGDRAVVTTVITDIPSDRTADAYVGENLNTSALSAPVAGSGAIRIGVDPNVAPPNGTEYRGFIDFPLSGPGGVPLTATIASATLDINIASLQFISPFPIRIDMIDAPPPFVSSDYDVVVQLPVLTLDPSVTGFNVVGTGRYLVDITPFMQQAQTMALPSLQLRLLLPLTAPALGLVTIDDSSIAVQPFLTVEYL